MGRPLDGVLVVSLEQAIAAPYCTRMLADLGARVIKVERPDGGDFARAYDQRARGLSSHFVWTNRSKESLVLDLKDPQQVEMLKTIVARADVFVQNLLPGAIERLGLAPALLRQFNPRMITCSISGYGQEGTHAGRKAYDLLIQAESGLISVTGTMDDMAKAGISIADIAAGVAAYNTILAALLNRHRTGEGDHIEVSMLRAMVEWMGFPLYFSIDGQEPPRRSGARHATIYPYGPFRTADGEILLALQNDREWFAFASVVLERPDLAGCPRFAGNSGRIAARAELQTVIDGVFSTLASSEALSRMEKAGIGTANVNDMAQVWTHPQLASAWKSFDTPVGEIPALTPISGQAWVPRMDPLPALGEHTAAILREFGIETSAAS